MSMDKIYKKLKKIKLRNLIILILLLAFNAYAWFIYASKVSVGLTASVSSWDVEFVSDTGEVITNIDVDVERIYPGMETFEKKVEVHNKGQTGATLSYEIRYLKIMDEVYEVTEDSGWTTEDIENKVEQEYPFKIIIEMEDNGLSVENGKGSFNIKIEWPYESGNDELDTIWGNKAYEYYSLHPGEKSIEMKIDLIATQQNT